MVMKVRLLIAWYLEVCLPVWVPTWLADFQKRITDWLTCKRWGNSLRQVLLIFVFLTGIFFVFIYSWCRPQSNCSQLSKITENQSIKILSLSLSLWFTRHLFGKVYYAFLFCCCNIVTTKQSVLSGAFPEYVISCFNYTFINSVNWR